MLQSSAGPCHNSGARPPGAAGAAIVKRGGEMARSRRSEQAADMAADETANGVAEAADAEEPEDQERPATIAEEPDAWVPRAVA